MKKWIMFFGAGLGLMTTAITVQAFDLGVEGARKFKPGVSPVLERRERLRRIRNRVRLLRLIRTGRDSLAKADISHYRPGNALWHSVCVRSGRRIDHVKLRMVVPGTVRYTTNHHVVGGWLPARLPRGTRCLRLGNNGRDFRWYFRLWKTWARRALGGYQNWRNQTQLMSSRSFITARQECIVRISGSTGIAKHKRRTRSVFSLTIYTSWGRRMSWGRPTRDRFDLIAPRGHEISRIRLFQGRELDAIGAITRANRNCFRR